MLKWKRRLFWLLGLLLLLGLLAVGFLYLYLDLVVDFWWFQSLGYSRYFLLRLVYRYLVFSGAVLFFGLLFFLNFWIASRYLGRARPRSKGRESEASKGGLYPELVDLVQTGSLKVYAPLSLVLAVFVAFPLFREWEALLFYLFAPPAAVADAAFGVDVGFYLFSLPVYTLVQQRLLAAAVIVLAGAAVLYRIERRMLRRKDETLPRGAKIHLNLLALALVFLYGANLWLQRYQMVYDSDHMPLFFGAGFTQMRVTLPLIWGCVLLWFAAALAVLFVINFRKGLIAALTLCALFAAATGLRHTDYLNRVVQKYIVDPNELTKERPYIEKNIAGTLSAYKLSNVETRNFALDPNHWEKTRDAIRLNIQNIPVWDRTLLEDVYDQLQGIRPYYNFTGVDVDRYTVGGSRQQVNLAAREINLERMPAHAQNWINRRLQYTHGYGAVMTPAAQRGEEIMTWFIEGIPPRSDFDFRIEVPGIYFGLENYPYVVVPNEVGEMDYPAGDGFSTTDFRGETGIALSSLVKKLLLALYLKDRNLFFTTKTSADSRLLMHRNVPEAIRLLTPFLTLDADPYIVVTREHLFWIQDAYTRSRWYPYGTPYDGVHNYIRNSVKIVVNAYDGSIQYYLSDAGDPVACAYQRMYPGLLQPLSKMPTALKTHLRYPKDIFKIQMTMYHKYHQKDPETFYREEDVWDFTTQPGDDPQKGENAVMEPYYLTLNLLDSRTREFLLVSPMSPRSRPNLRALTIAGCDGDRYGKFYVYSFPKGEQVYGPAQIDALIDQDTEIAEQFTLWDQVGSEVRRGRMIVLPMGNAVFYIQPLYLSAAAKLKIPQLQRLIVSQGDVVVMDTSLEKAFDQLEQELRARPNPAPYAPAAPLSPREQTDDAETMPDAAGQENAAAQADAP